MATKAPLISHVLDNLLTYFLSVILAAEVMLVNILAPFIGLGYDMGKILVLWWQVTLDAFDGTPLLLAPCMESSQLR